MKTKKYTKEQEEKKKDFKYFYHLIVSNKEDLEHDIAILKKGKSQIKKGIFAGKNVKVEPNVFFDTSAGKIVIGENTKIKANAVLRGPLIIGVNSQINSFAEISCSRIGNVCKVGGEVEGSIIASYTNKQHHGCLGHSYVGSWVNIGAGTNVSDLKNTYGNIKMGGIDTGMQFLGAVIMDYAKTAINSSIFCGKIIGESSHVYGTVTHDVPAFTSHVSAGNMYELPLEVAMKVQKAMMKRRGIDFTKADSENFIKLFKDTAEDRKMRGVKKEKLNFK